MKIKEQNWIQFESYEELNNDDFWKIITFYVFHTPCNNLSAQVKTLEDYGWVTPWLKPYKLNLQLKEASSNFGLIYSVPTRKKLNEALEKAGISKKFPPDKFTEVACFHDNKKINS